jgi:hypothetical protein
MPDMCESRVTVTGSAGPLREFRSRCFVTADSGRPEFSFDSIIPMPAILSENRPGFNAEVCFIALGISPYLHLYSPFTLEGVLSFGWVKEAGINTRQELLAYLEKNMPEDMKAARRCVESMSKTGYLTWYAWRTENWGTKWPASATEILTENAERIEFYFANPWEFPWPVFKELGRQFPSLRFDFVSIDAGTGYGMRGYVAGPKIAENTIDHAEIDDIERRLFNPYAAPTDLIGPRSSSDS